MCRLARWTWVPGIAGLSFLLPLFLAGQDAALHLDREARELVLTLGPADLPAHALGAGTHADHGMHGDPPGVADPMDPGHLHAEPEDPHAGAVHLPSRLLRVPGSGSIRGYRIEVVDRHGAPVPRSVLHHVDVIRPDRRELFLPVAQRLFAAGQDTPDFRSPPWLLGLAVEEGEVWEVLGMLHNPTGRGFEGVEVRIHFSIHPEFSFLPLLSVLPFHLNVTFPAGRTDWDLPPGTNEWSWEGSPAVPVRVLALSGHLHAGADWIRLEDVSRGRVLWEGAPAPSHGGGPETMPVGRPFLRGGVPLRPDRVYRVTARYTNPTGAPIPGGGMGVVGGVAILARSAEWPSADPSDPLYRRDQEYYRSQSGGAGSR